MMDIDPCANDSGAMPERGEGAQDDPSQEVLAPTAALRSYIYRWKDTIFVILGPKYKLQSTLQKLLNMLHKQGVTPALGRH